MSAIVEASFKSAMRRMAATVNLITLSEGGVPKGMAATAVSSLSMDPPSLLVCVNRSASLHEPMGAATQFCVNVLHADQIEIARIFADNSLREVRFNTGRWAIEPGKAPYLEDAQAALFCDVDQTFSYGTHTIFIGRVTEVRVREHVDPLIYVDGGYRAPLPRRD
jgi:flavin reductase (DIM6/NTAB) family NADH-FMN oxidoreductase RutF